jgi:hypothetical protein
METTFVMIGIVSIMANVIYAITLRRNQQLVLDIQKEAEESRELYLANLAKLSEVNVSVTLDSPSYEDINKTLRKLSEDLESHLEEFKRKGTEIFNELPEEVRNNFALELIENKINVEEYLSKEYLGPVHLLDGINWKKSLMGDDYWRNVAGKYL